MTRPDVEYRARTLVHVLELMEGHVCGCDPEFQKIRDAIRGCLPELEELTGEMLPELVEPMKNPAGAFYLMALADALEGMINGIYAFEVPKVVADNIHWICRYFREQLDRDFMVRVQDWNG